MSAVGGADHSKDEHEYRVTYVELQRVLHVMEHDSYEISSQTPASWYHSRADRLRTLWQKLIGIMQQQQLPRFSRVDMDSLQKRVAAACQRSDQATAGLFNQSGDANNSIRQLLFQTSKVKRTQQTNDEQEDDEQQDEDTTSVENEEGALSATPERRPSALDYADERNKSVLSPEALQAQQREQMEEAIQQMASQMKEETARIHQTLRSQTANLNELETVTTENVDKVTKVTEDVNEHVRQGWTRALGTWTMLFVMIGAFAFTLLTILMAPKRRDVPCLFFCGDSRPATTHPVPSRTGEESDQFCRVLRDGTRQCIHLNGAVQKGGLDDGDNQKEEECQLNTAGECVHEEDKDASLSEEDHGFSEDKDYGSHTDDTDAETDFEYEGVESVDSYDPIDHFDNDEEDDNEYFDEENSYDDVEEDNHEYGDTYTANEVEEEVDEDTFDDDVISHESMDNEAVGGDPRHGEFSETEGEEDIDQTYVGSETPRDQDMQAVDGNGVFDEIEDENEGRHHYSQFDSLERDSKGTNDDPDEFDDEDEPEAPVGDSEGSEGVAKDIKDDTIEKQEQVQEVKTRESDEASDEASSEQDQLDQTIDDMMNHAGKDQHGEEADEEQGLLDQALDELLNHASQEQESEQELLDQALDDLLKLAQKQEDTALQEFEEKDPNELSNGAFEQQIEQHDEKEVANRIRNRQQDDNFANSRQHRKDAEDGRPGDPFAAQNIVKGGSAAGGGASDTIPMFRNRPFSPKDLRRAAATGDATLLEGYLNVRPDWSKLEDSNGWTAWHLAARSGRADAIQVLRSSGGGGALLKTVDGRTARDVAVQKWGVNHPVVRILSS